MTIVYQKSLPGSNSWEDVKTLNEIPVEAWPHVFALLDDGQAFTCREPLDFVGVRFRAVFEDAPFSDPYNPMITKLCQRLQQAEIDKKVREDQLVTYQILDETSGQWRKAELEEIPVEAWRHIFALGHLEEFECVEPLLYAGRKIRAFWQDQSPECYSENSLIPEILRVHAFEFNEKDRKRQNEFRELFSRFEAEAKKRRDEIQKALLVLATLQAEAFEGSHNERHAKLARAMVQIREIATLCEEIPNLLTHATNDIPF